MDSEYFAKLVVLNNVFTPSAPIEHKDMLAGRNDQLHACLDVLHQRGVHIVLYGDRGVGKTSIANIIKVVTEGTFPVVVKRSCDTYDTFEGLWRKVLREIKLDQEFVTQSIGFRAVESKEKQGYTADLLVADNVYSAQNVVSVLESLPKPVLIILDEFDRLENAFNKRLFADTLKNISDNIPEVTLMLVGVGENVSEIIGEHASVERNIKQIPLPLLHKSELSAIITNGLRALEMRMEDGVKDKIVEYSGGYPHYAHLLAYNACKAALRMGESSVNKACFDTAVAVSISEAHESLRLAYQRATLATKQNIYKEVLWACSVVPTDENGTFQAKDLEVPLSLITDSSASVNQFTYHLGKFTSDERGCILTTLGVPKRQRYKFRNPLMRAFIRLHMHVRPKP